ncbi:uncharacterized protein LOC134705995 [Mytilus trossulus]|uniref:uncharacterized protein LOC134705995 n=1 Tax=Mytilus trossulus TaxID=6551 RepID=UPI003003C4D1
MISMEDYRKIEDITIKMNCGMHGKKLNLYCKKHEIAVCVTCIASEHKSCSSSNVISIEEASKRAKQSAADLEQLITRTLENFKYFINNREIALENVDKDEQTIRKTIEDTRLNLNEYLNELERKLLLDLRSKHANCQSQYTKSLRQLNQKRIEKENLKEQIIKMKHSASDIQVFLGTHQCNKAISEQIGSRKKDIRFHTDTSMKLEIDPFINSFMEEVTQFGEIRVTETNVGQAKTQTHGSKQNICNISLQLKQKFYIKGCVVPITGCIILSDYRIIFADYTGSMLMEYNNKGKHIRDILVDHRPFDLAAVYSDRIVVSYGVSKYMEIINTNRENEGRM